MPAATIDAAAARLADMPLVIGEWSGRDLAVNPREQAIANADGFLRRRYVNSRTGSVVTVLLLCGRPGPLSLHTPDVCFSGAGFEGRGNASKYEIPDSPGNHLWVCDYQKVLPSPVFLRVFYGWSANGTWEAPDNPRFAFVRSPVLFKLYVVRELADPNDPVKGDPAGDLMRALSSPLRAVLFATS